jgi:hypothetical protein
VETEMRLIGGAVRAFPFMLVAACQVPDLSVLADLCDEAFLRRIESEERRILGFSLSQILVEPSPSGGTQRIAQLRVGESVLLFVDVSLGLGCPDEALAGRFASARWTASNPRVVTIDPMGIHVPTADLAGARAGDTALTIDFVYKDGVTGLGRLYSSPGGGSGGDPIDIVRVVR